MIGVCNNLSKQGSFAQVICPPKRRRFDWSGQSLDMCDFTPGMARSFLLERPRIFPVWLTISTSSMRIGWASRFCILVQGVRGLDSVGKDTRIHRLKSPTFAFPWHPKVELGLGDFIPSSGDFCSPFCSNCLLQMLLPDPHWLDNVKPGRKKTWKLDYLFGDYKACFFDQPGLIMA